MFTSFTTRLRGEIDTLKLVLDAHDGLRTLIYASEPSEGQGDAHLEHIRQSGLLKPAWQIYDHCAAFTRLYAIYEQFVDDLASDYLRVLPQLYRHFVDLPQSVRIQLRLGIGQILGKLGKDGPYRDLAEMQVIEGWAEGLLGKARYSLLSEAFLIDQQNYRSSTLANLFRYLGFEDCWRWIEKHPAMIAYMTRQRDANETPKTLLHDLVEYRNKASHTDVRETVAVDEIKSIADYVTVLCDALSQLLMRQVIQRKRELGEAVCIGVVIHKFSDLIVGVRTSAGSLKVDEELVIMQKHSCQFARVVSIQIGDVPHMQVDMTEDLEIGLKLTEHANEGAELVRVSPLHPALLPEALPEMTSPDEPAEMVDQEPPAEPSLREEEPG
jgi:hypothetical protein